MSRLLRLLSIWFRLVLTSLDVLWYTAQLQYQRLKFTLQDTIRYYRKSERRKVANKPKKVHRTEVEALHNSSIHYPHSRTP